MSNETRRILLVEDEKAIRDAVTAYLERENYQRRRSATVRKHSRNLEASL